MKTCKEIFDYMQCMRAWNSVKLIDQSIDIIYFGVSEGGKSYLLVCVSSLL